LKNRKLEKNVVLEVFDYQIKCSLQFTIF